MKKKRMLFQYFLSYLLLIIPMLLAGFWVTFSVAEKTKQEADQRIEYQVGQFVQMLSKQAVNYRDKAVKISSIAELSDTVLEDYKTDRMKAIKYLGNIAMLDDFVDELMIFLNNRLYMGRGYSRPDVYFRDTLLCEEESVQLALDVLSKEEQEVVYLKSARGGILLLHYPVSGKERSINYCLKESSLYTMMSGLLDSRETLIQLTFRNREQQEEIYLSGNIAEGIQHMNGKKFHSLVSQKGWITSENSVESMGIEIDVFYRAEELYKEIQESLRTNEIIMGILLLMAIVISYKLSKSHYKRIYSLRTTLETASSYEKTGSDVEFRNDFDYMHSMVRHMVTENACVKTENERAQETLKEQMAMLLFRGVLKDTKMISYTLELCGLELQEPFFAIACIADEFGTDDFSEKMEDVLAERLGCFCEIDNRRAVAVLFELPNEDLVRSSREQLAEMILSKFSSHDRVRIGFSQPYDNILRSSGAYLEAAGICEKLLSGRKQNVEYMDTVIDRRKHIIQFEENDLEEFTASLESGKYERVQECLDRMFSYMEGAHFSEENRRYLRYSLLQNLMTGIRNMELEDDSIRRKIEQIDLQDGEGFKEAVRRIVKKLCTPKDKKEKIDFADVIDYINQNYRRYDLSLEEVAEHVGLTKTYMSFLFKQKTGKKYIEYLTKCRMEEAKRLILETDYTIKEISAMVGYTNVPGFRNKFKDYYGINASEYKKKVKSEEEGMNDTD